MTRTFKTLLGHTIVIVSWPFFYIFWLPSLGWASVLWTRYLGFIEDIIDPQYRSFGKEYYLGYLKFEYMDKQGGK